MDIRNAVFDCKFCGQSDKPCEHFIAAVTDAPAPLQPTYYVRHPDDSYSVADPQPVGKAEAERWEALYAEARESLCSCNHVNQDATEGSLDNYTCEWCLKHKDASQPPRVIRQMWEAEAAAERLTAELKETNKRLALAEKLLNDWTEAELERTRKESK